MGEIFVLLPWRNYTAVSQQYLLQSGNSKQCNGVSGSLLSALKVVSTAAVTDFFVYFINKPHALFIFFYFFLILYYLQAGGEVLDIYLVLLELKIQR